MAARSVAFSVLNEV